MGFLLDLPHYSLPVGLEGEETTLKIDSHFEKAIDAPLARESPEIASDPSFFIYGQ